MIEHKHDPEIHRALAALIRLCAANDRAITLARVIRIATCELAKTHGMRAAHRVTDLALHDAIGVHGGPGGKDAA